MQSNRIKSDLDIGRRPHFALGRQLHRIQHLDQDQALLHVMEKAAVNKL